MKQLEIYLQDRQIGTVKIDSVRGRETWMFAYAPSFVTASNPMLDPDVANVRGPQFPRGGAGFGFLSDIAPDRWGRKLIRCRRAFKSRQRPGLALAEAERDRLAR